MNSSNGQSITLYYSPELRDRWPRPLADQWALKYPQIFDPDDLRLTIKQTRGHFYEWFVAIHLYETQKVLSLVEKYCCHNHQRKVDLLNAFLSVEHYAFLRKFRGNFGVQPPDLFVYVPGTKHFWFGEVKGPGDRLSDLQRYSHAALTKKLGVDVQMFYVRPR